MFQASVVGSHVSDHMMYSIFSPSQPSIGHQTPPFPFTALLLPNSVMIKSLKLRHVPVFRNGEEGRCSSSLCSTVKAVPKEDGQVARVMEGLLQIFVPSTSPPTQTSSIRHHVFFRIHTFSLAKILYSFKVFMPLGCVISQQDLSNLN